MHKQTHQIARNAPRAPPLTSRHPPSLPHYPLHEIQPLPNKTQTQSARYVLDCTQLPTRAHYGVPEDRFVLCNFNQLYKMDPAIFSTWMSVLRRVPNAVLWLLRFPPAGEANIRKEARSRGVRDEQVCTVYIIKLCFIVSFQ